MNSAPLAVVVGMEGDPVAADVVGHVAGRVQVDPVRVERHLQPGQGEDLLPRFHHVLLTPDGVTVRRNQDAAVGEELTQTVQVPRHDRPVPGPGMQRDVGLRPGEGDVLDEHERRVRPRRQREREGLRHVAVEEHLRAVDPAAVRDADARLEGLPHAEGDVASRRVRPAGVAPPLLIDERDLAVRRPILAGVVVHVDNAPDSTMARTSASPSSASIAWLISSSMALPSALMRSAQSPLASASATEAVTDPHAVAATMATRESPMVRPSNAPTRAPQYRPRRRSSRTPSPRPPPRMRRRSLLFALDGRFWIIP